jgi:D-alanyl-D-alanine carboxypeptidase
MPTLGTVDQLVPINAAPPNQREETCGKNRKRPAAEDDEVEVSANGDGSSPLSFLLSNLQSNVKVSTVLANGNPMLPAVPVFVGAVKPSSVAAAEAQESQLAGGGGKRGKKNAKAKNAGKTKVAAKPKPDAVEKPKPSAKPKPITTGAAAAGTGPKPAAKPTAAKPATQSAAKPEATSRR